jgi:hypothetical protein
VYRLRRMQDQWAALDEAILGSGLDNHFIPPWESSHPAIHAAWDKLTDPDNLADLEYWLAFYDDGARMNDWAREATQKAIKACRAKKGN